MNTNREFVKEITYQSIELTKQELGYTHSIDMHALSNMSVDAYMEIVRNSMVIGIRKWFLDRELKSYSYSHPKNLWHLLLHFVFYWWPSLEKKLVKHTVVSFSVKEIYGNVSLPDYHPSLIIQKYVDDREERLNSNQ